ncbi:MAG: lysylphosphatidylglycerol synthase domain-containing protein [Bacteroidota bacterium]
MATKSLVKAIKIIFAAIIIISLALFIRSTDLQKIWTSLLQVGFKFFTIIVTTFLAYLLGAVGWRFCMSADGRKIAVPMLFMIRQVSETVALLNPASIVGGEAVKVALLKNAGLKSINVIPSIIISRSIMIATHVFLLVIAGLTIAISLPPGILRQNIAIAGLVFSILVIIFMVVFKHNDRLRTLFVSTNLQVPGSRMGKIKTRIKSVLREVHLYLATERKAVVFSALFFALHWIIGSLEFYFILKFLGININLADALFLDMGVILFKSAGAYVPAQAGFEEYGNKIMLSLIGIAGNEIWMTVSLLKRIRQLFWITASGFFYLYVRKNGSDLFNRTNGNIICEP